MNRLRMIGLVLFFMVFLVDAQSPSGDNDATSGDDVSNFQPSLRIVIGILCAMFGLTLSLVVCAKFCRRGATVHVDNNHPGILDRTRSRFSGIDKKVVESLPLFKFSSLKGSKQGLECSVCLGKFGDTEILRLLPKCNHAFHVDCIDQWLEKHSSCPLCRQKVKAEDPTIFTYSNSMRFLRNQSELREDSNIELYVGTEQENHGSSSRFSIGSSLRKIEESTVESEVLIQEEANKDDDDDDNDDDDGKVFHKFNHSIIVSDVVLKNRWSNASSSDLMFLNSEMLKDMSSDRFYSREMNDLQFPKTKSIENEQTMKIKISSTNENNTVSAPVLPLRSKIVNHAEKRSMSEITALSRCRNVITKNRTSECSLSETHTKDETTR